MIPLCITTDDYGLNAGVNEAIESLAHSRAITAVSLMVHPDAALDSARSLRDTGVATGLHLTFVGERPLLGARLDPLLDGEGRLPTNYASLFARVLLRPSLLPLLRAEAHAQIERFLALGLPLDFLNSHQHVHLFPPVWAILGEVFRAHPRAWIRSASASRPSLSRQGALGLSSRVCIRIRPEPGRKFLHPIGIDFAGATTLPQLEKALGRLRDPGPDSMHELVMHPGIAHAGAAQRHLAWRYDWEREYGILASPSFRALLARLRMQPTTCRA